MSILQTIDLKKYYGTEPNITKALDGVNFSVEEGEFVAVVGTSGSGKSTMLHMMGGLDTPTSGRVIVRGEELAKKNDEELTIFRRRNIGFIFQNYNLIDYLTPLENVRLVNKQAGKEILLELGLDETQIKRNVLQLSGGQQQRVAIARALVSEAPVILADEPTGNLDEQTAGDIIAILKKLAKERQKCVIVVTHSKEVAEASDVVLELSRRSLVEKSK